MGIKVIYTSLLLLVTLTICNRATAQSGCTTALIGLRPCLNYVTGNSSTPSSSCCTQLSNIVQTQPQCLCVLLRTDASSLGLAINRTLAFALPGACNVETPPVSRCNGVNGPAPAPAASSDSPADEAPEDPRSESEPDMPSGTGSKTVPTTDGGVVGGSNGGASFNVAGFLLLLASSWVFSGVGF